MLIKKNLSAVVVDAQVVDECAALDQAHQAKVMKYKVLGKVIKEKYMVDNIVFTFLTLSSRWIWSGQSFEHLLRLGLLKAKDAKILSSKVLIDGLHIVNVFNRSTAVLPIR